MMAPIESYKTIVFDCDGVVLNSNQIKTKAFYHVALAYGEVAAQTFVEYHVANGGVSRYEKFSFLLENIVPKVILGHGLDELLESYACKVRKGLLECEVANDLLSLRARTARARWLVVSGGDQNELRDIFELRNLTHLFDGGIFGSPDNKDVILERELRGGNVRQPALFLGDSMYDYEAAKHAGLDFVFLSDWSESRELLEWSGNEFLPSVASISSL